MEALGGDVAPVLQLPVPKRRDTSESSEAPVVQVKPKGSEKEHLQKEYNYTYIYIHQLLHESLKRKKQQQQQQRIEGLV